MLPPQPAWPALLFFFLRGWLCCCWGASADFASCSPSAAGCAAGLRFAEKAAARPAFSSSDDSSAPPPAQAARHLSADVSGRSHIISSKDQHSCILKPVHPACRLRSRQDALPCCCAVFAPPAPLPCASCGGPPSSWYRASLLRSCVSMPAAVSLPCTDGMLCRQRQNHNRHTARSCAVIKSERSSIWNGPQVCERTHNILHRFCMLCDSLSELAYAIRALWCGRKLAPSPRPAGRGLSSSASSGDGSATLAFTPFLDSHFCA